MNFQTKDLIKFKIKLPDFGLAYFMGVICEQLVDGSMRYIVKTIEPGLTDQKESTTMAVLYPHQLTLVERNYRDVVKNTDIGPYFYEWAR